MRNKKFYAFTAACMLSATLLFTGCSKGSDEAAKKGETFTATAAGLESDVSVTITVEDGKITDCTIDASGETEGIGTEVPGKLQDVIVANQGVDIETVSGATVTCDAVKAALADCMAQAGLAE